MHPFYDTVGYMDGMMTCPRIGASQLQTLMLLTEMRSSLPPPPRQKNDMVIILLGIIATGILLIIVAFLYYIQRTDEVKMLEDTSSEDSTSSDSDTSWDPEQGEKQPKTFTAVVNATGGFAAAERPSLNVPEPPGTNGQQSDGKRGPDTFEPPEQGSKKKDFVHELATLAILRDTGNLTHEEFAYSKNLILYE